jgi:HK97 family phage prohead protease
MSEKEVKNIDLEFKTDSEGKVSAVFSVFNNLDSDGDVVVPGAIKSGFKSGDVPMVWAHKWDMPIGKGQITSDGDKATFNGEFFMDTESGKEAYKIVKNMGDMQQWSFGYRVNDSERGQFGDDEKDARFLKDLTVYEVSPVLVGANQDTYTMAIKSNTELLEELTGVEEDQKGVLGNSTFFEQEPEDEAGDDTDDVKCSNCQDMIDNPEKYLKELSESVEEVKEEISEEGSKSFSEQVKDVLAALNDLMVRATAIAMLRAKDGRKLGEKATEALRAVQDDLQDAWVEIDQFIDNVGDTEDVVVEDSVDVEEEQSVEEIEDVDTEEPVVEEVEVESNPEVEPVQAEDNTDSVDEEAEALWLEAQQNIAESLDAELEVEDNI